MREPLAIDAAVQARADALGFVFAESVREVSPQVAAQLTRTLPGRIARIAVTLRPSQRRIDAMLREFTPDALQIDVADIAGLRLPQELALLPVLRDGVTMPESALPERVLFDAKVSGAGELSDWSGAQQLARRTQLVLAGGLAPENVAAAISAVQPFGVDVSSGVESARGRKDPERIAQFIAAARRGDGERTT
ncbi:MAG: phosphoribosylanthranilate isomerase [Steroidobacteraceae bacterium]